MDRLSQILFNYVMQGESLEEINSRVEEIAELKEISNYKYSMIVNAVYHELQRGM